MREPSMIESAGRRAFYADVIGGVTTFFTMAYIVIVNPGILSTPGTGMPFSGALTATVLVASSMTLLMGLYARLPFAVAPGMGLNAFFAFTIVIQNKVPWQTALGMVFWAGVLFLLVSRHAAAGTDRAGHSAGAPEGSRRRHRPAAHVHRPQERRHRRGRSGDDRPHGRTRPSCRVPCARHSDCRGADATRQSACVSCRDFVVTALAWATGYAQGPIGSSVRRTFRPRSSPSTSAAHSGSRCCRRSWRFSLLICSTRSRRLSASAVRPGSPIRRAAPSTCVEG